MSNEANETITVEPVVDPVIEPTFETVPVETPAPIEPEVKRYEYQPTDEQGRPLGGKQVIKYTTQEELTAGLVKNNVELLRKLRSETRKNRLGISDQEVIPDEQPRYEQPVSFNPKSLSPEDQYELARKLGVDPEQFDTITDELFEVKIGVKPSELRRTLTELQTERVNARALAESNAFMAVNPDYVKCQENSEAIVSWMIKKNLAPVQANYQLAYNTLLNAGVLIANVLDISDDPTPIPEPEPIIPIEPEPVVEPVTPPAPVEFKPAHIPSGFTRETSTDSGPAPAFGDNIVYEVVVGNTKRRYTGLAAVNAMPGDEFKRRVNSDRTFGPTVEKLEKEAAERRRNRR